MSLLSAIANRKSARHQEAVKRYVAILENGNDSDADQLLELMESLGWDEEKVAGDLKLMQAWESACKRYQTRRELSKKLTAAEESLNRLKADLATFIAGGGNDSARDKEVERAQIRFNQADCDYRSVCNEIDHLIAMKKKHADLFADKSLPI